MLPAGSSADRDHVHARAQPNSVDTAAIQDDAVTAAKIATNAVGASELADNAVDTAAIADNAVTLAKMADNSVGSAEIGANSITFDDVNAAFPRGLLAAPTTLTASSSSTSGTTELDLALDQTVTVGSGRRVRLLFSHRNLLGTTQQDLFEIRFKENSTQVAAFRSQVHEVTAHIDPPPCVHTYTPTAGSRTFEVFLVRVAGTGTAQVIAASTSPAVFTVEDVGG